MKGGGGVGGSKGPKITALSPFFCHPFFFLFLTFLFSPSTTTSSSPPPLPFFLFLSPFHPWLSSPYLSSSLPCCLDDHRTACSQMRGWRRNSVKGRKGGRRAGEENEKLLPVTAIPEEGSLLFVKRSSSLVIQTCHELYQFSLHTTAKYCSS